MPGSVGVTDHFPSTHATWIADRIRASSDAARDSEHARLARAELNAHVMERYFKPLCAYVRGGGWRDLGEGADLVNGFFASRLDDPDYLMRWRESGLPLRRWLMNGILLHLRERVRSERRAARKAAPHDPGLLERVAVDSDHAPEAKSAMDRAWAEGVVEAAVRETVAALESAGRERAWVVFRRHFVDGMAYDALARQTGSPVKELKAQVKLVQRWLRDGIARVLQQDGVDAEAIEAETDRLVAMLLR